MLLHAQVERNRRKTWILAVVFLLFFAAVGASVGLLMADSIELGLILAAVIGGVYVALMMASGTRMVMAINGATEVESEDDNPFLWNTVESLAIGARLPMPKVYIIDDPSPNAFAAGMSPKNAAVAVTTGLLERLDRQEVEAVLAHEVAHIRNYDVRLATTAVALVAVIVILSDIARRMMWYSGGRRRSSSDKDNKGGHPAIYLIALLFIILGPLVATMIQLAISRNREYLADSSGAELCRNPNALASALRKIAAIPEPMEAASEACASLYFTNPFKKKRNLFSTHPPTEERIRRLEQMM